MDSGVLSPAAMVSPILLISFRCIADIYVERCYLRPLEDALTESTCAPYSSLVGEMGIVCSWAGDNRSGPPHLALSGSNNVVKMVGFVIGALGLKGCSLRSTGPIARTFRSRTMILEDTSSGSWKSASRRLANWSASKEHLASLYGV